ncbi:MAG TPA: T9SS type A sorting domain-containing protein, partial [Gemmatimonadales bacterium]|nr:T9SS type A sorting domain-containing protein [Gemmatimonadales bacterium]
VQNSFTYYYAVTAFDVNSVESVGVGSTSLESPRATKTITPRKPSGQQSSGSITETQVVGFDGNVVPAGAAPSLDAATGVWSGPQQPTDALQLGLAAFIPEVLGNGALVLKVDSITPGFGDSEGGSANSVPAIYYVTVQGSGAAQNFAVPLATDCCDIINEVTANFAATPITTSKSTRYGGDSTYQLYGSATISQAPPWFSAGPGRGDANADPENSSYNGPRWFADPATSEVADPNGVNCHPSVGTCVRGHMTGKLSAGTLPGVSALWSIQSYNTVRSQPGRQIETITATVSRAADILVKWGANGAIDSVFDEVHRVSVPFNTGINASWGILDTTSFAGVSAAATGDGNNALITHSDITCVAPLPTFTAAAATATRLCHGTATATLRNKATLSPVSDSSVSNDGTLGVPATGTGFIFYLNGKFFLMQMAALPAAGTRWHARFYTGNITGTAADGDFAFQAAPRTPAIPGLRVQVAYEGAVFDPATTTTAQLANVHTVPDPYYVTNALEQSPNSKKLRFVNLPSQAIVRIYTVSGILVNVLTLNDVTGGGEVEWNLRNRNNQFVASGVYFYQVETPDGKTKTGRFTVVNFAQ